MRNILISVSKHLLTLIEYNQDHDRSILAIIINVIELQSVVKAIKKKCIGGILTTSEKKTNYKNPPY